MLDKRVALSVTEAGLGDNNGSRDYKGRDVHEYKIDEDGKLVRTDGCTNADGVEDIEAACLDDYTENPNILLKEGVTFGYGGRVWYGVTVMNKHVDSPMHGEADSSVTGEQDPGAFARLDQPNEYLIDESGNRQKIQDLTAEGSKDKKPSVSDLREYEDQLEVRRRKLAESGDVAHGAFVFSDYLPWVLPTTRAPRRTRASASRRMTAMGSPMNFWTSTRPEPRDGPLSTIRPSPRRTSGTTASSSASL